jgi:hypothetical protein
MIRGIFLALIVVSSALLQAEPKPGEPSAEQLAAAKEAYAKHGAEYRAVSDPQTKRTTHTFHLPIPTTDEDLAEMPDLPFPFELYLANTEVGDEGLKELKKLKNLVSLDRRLLKRDGRWTKGTERPRQPRRVVP